MRVFGWIALALLLTPSPSRQAEGPAAEGGESLHYSVEWRFVHAGDVRLRWTPGAEGIQARLQLQSAGLVSMLYRVDDLYTAHLASNLCAVSSTLVANEGSRSRETKITYGTERGKAVYIERDLKKNSTVASLETDVPACVHEIVGALYHLRRLRLAPGRSADIALTDGKKSAMVRVEAQQAETVSTPAGAFKTVRYEASVFNGVIYRRPGRLHIWLTDDDRRLPVQIRARMQFYIGSITLQLEKAEAL